ncbi:MAG: DUF1311 domain-containing protein [Deltaproteobacteria bacterium]|nr:DUF1311 domain-containing protein [Deltaproteobacteria bacterium]
MVSSRSHRLRVAILVATLPTVLLGTYSVIAEPLVSETTSKVLTTIAHIIIERVGGSTVDRIVGPYVDDTLKTYLRGDPKRALEQQQTQVNQKLSDSAEKDIPVLKAQLALIQEELRALRALRQATPNSATTTQVSSNLQEGVTHMERKLNDRGTELAGVERNLKEVAVRFEQADMRQPAPSTAPQPAQLKKPSFNCRKAKTKTELLICREATLGDIDGRLGEVYWELHRFLVPSEARELKKQEIAWIRRRDQQLTTSCTTDDEVDLPCVIGLWKERVDQLEAQLQIAKARRL